MRTNVIFRHPAEFVSVAAEDGILSAQGADWFVSLLRQIPGLEVEPCLFQEDWGVVAFVRRGGKRFWIGLSLWPDEEQMWLAHFHHHSSAWLQKLSASGKSEFERLILDTHAVFSADPSVSLVRWHHERDTSKRQENGSDAPAEAKT